jgi:hypothetical protein
MLCLPIGSVELNSLTKANALLPIFSTGNLALIAYNDADVVCIGQRSKASLQYPGTRLHPKPTTQTSILNIPARSCTTAIHTGPASPWATVTTTLGLEMFNPVDRTPFLSAVLAYLTEKVALNVTVAPAADTGTGTVFKLFLASTITTNTSAVPSFTLTYGTSNKTDNVQAKSVEEEVTISHCFESSGNNTVSVVATSAYGTVVAWSGSVAATKCDSSAASSMHGGVAVLTSLAWSLWQALWW